MAAMLVRSPQIYCGIADMLEEVLTVSRISLDSIIVEAYCRWNLSSGNLYTFIRPNQEQLRKMQL
jgi:hypothetical protein